MKPSRLWKQVARAFKVTWRDQPNRYDIEALQENIRRVGVVIRVRWALVAVLVVYSLLAGAAYAIRVPQAQLAQLMVVPALSLGFVVGYNLFFGFTYRRFGNFRVFNHAQLALDTIVVTLLVYHSGGIGSWFAAMYSLFILEAAFILPKRRDAWFVAGSAAILLGLVVGLEYAGLLPGVDLPFAVATLNHDGIYIAVRFLWELAVIMGTASVATLLVESSADQELAHASTILDPVTGLHSRAYFQRALAAESARAMRDGRQLHLILIDLDRFGEFNRRFSIERGDQLLKRIADALAACMSDAGDSAISTNIVARHGGEEFAMVLSENVVSGRAPSAADAAGLAECARRSIAATTIDDAGVTAAIGVASLPTAARTATELQNAADEALARAIEAGGNRAVFAPAAPDAFDVIGAESLNLVDPTEV